MIGMLSQYFRIIINKMNIIYAVYNIHYDSIDTATTTGYLLRIDCREADVDKCRGGGSLELW